MFITKALTFVNRKEFKDIYDIAHLIGKVDECLFKKRENVIKLLQDVIQTLNQENIKGLYKTAFKNVDLKFRDLKESELESFIQKTIKKLNILINKLKRY